MYILCILFTIRFQAQNRTSVRFRPFFYPWGRLWLHEDAFTPAQTCLTELVFVVCTFRTGINFWVKIDWNLVNFDQNFRHLTLLGSKSVKCLRLYQKPVHFRPILTAFPHSQPRECKNWSPRAPCRGLARRIRRHRANDGLVGSGKFLSILANLVQFWDHLTNLVKLVKID